MIRRLAGAVALASLLIALAIHAIVRMPLLAPIGDAAASSALAYARAALEQRSTPTLLGERSEQAGLPVILTLYDRGVPVVRGEGHGRTFGAALTDAVTKLGVLDPLVLRRGRLKLDRIIGRGYLSSTVLPLLALGMVPARDGVGGEAQGKAVYFTVDDLLRRGLASGYQPLPVLEFALGLDVRRAVRALTDALELPGRGPPERLFRFRAEEYIEPAGEQRSAALPIIGGTPPGPPVSKDAFAAAARAGGDYLLRHLDASGHFDYEYYTVEDSRPMGDGYSVPRHAGAASFLSQLYALDRDPRVRAGAERALDALAQMRPEGCDGERICVGEARDTTVDIGSSALSIVAAAEYVRTTGDHRYDAFTRGLTEFVLSMQKASGDFCHLYQPRTKTRDEQTQLLYYSGEAAYGLAKLLALGAAKDDPQTTRVAGALDHALEYLCETSYDNLAGQFYVGEDHWTCMALDAGWDYLAPARRERYARFCDGFGDFLRRSQFRAGEALVRAQPQLEGAYGMIAALAPHATPVGSRSETTISIWRIARRRGLPELDWRVAHPREQVLDGMRFLLAHQIRDDSAYLMPNPEAARGGFLQSDVDRYIRIDFIQHGCSALLRAIEML